MVWAVSVLGARQLVGALGRWPCGAPASPELRKLPLDLIEALASEVLGDEKFVLPLAHQRKDCANVAVLQAVFSFHTEPEIFDRGVQRDGVLRTVRAHALGSADFSHQGSKVFL